MAGQEISKGSPYIKLGFRIYQRQIKLKISNEQLCNAASMTRERLRDIVMGRALPDPKECSKLAKTLDFDENQFFNWVSYERRKARSVAESFEDNPLKGALAYAESYEKICKEIDQIYFETTGKRLSGQQQKLLATLTKDLSRTFFLPPLPSDLMLLLDALVRNKDKKYLHEINSSLIDGESFSGTLARNLPLAAFMAFVANIFCFEDSPSKNIIDCFNRLTVKAGREIILMATTKRNVYPREKELPFLTEHCEDITNEALFCRLLEPHLSQAGIDFNELYNSCMLQLGKYAIYTTLQPTLREDSEDSVSKDDVYAGLDTVLFRAILKYMANVTSAAIAGNWGYSQNVQDVLINQSQDSKLVSPLSAAFQMIKRFLKDDFAGLSPKQIDEIMSDYPQVPISSDVLIKIFIQLKNQINEHIEKSTSNMSKISVKAATYSSNRSDQIRRNISNLDLYLDHPMGNIQQFRFDEDYIKSVLVDCLILSDKEKNTFFLPGKTESLEEFSRRIGKFGLMVDFLAHRNLEILSQKFKISKEEAKECLKLK